MDVMKVTFLIFLGVLNSCRFTKADKSYHIYTTGSPLQLNYKQLPAPDGHRCGACPTYLQKICAFNTADNSTYVFDNHCIMDLYNCIDGTNFQPMSYDYCVYFGNFAYVHGFKYEDLDYGENHITVKGTKKTPDFVK